jgi:hypothetical protein
MGKHLSEVNAEAQHKVRGTLQQIDVVGPESVLGPTPNGSDAPVQEFHGHLGRYAATKIHGHSVSLGLFRKHSRLEPLDSACVAFHEGSCFSAPVSD